MPSLNRETAIRLAVTAVVLLPTFAGYAVAGVSLAVAFGLAAAVGLAVLDDVLQEDDRGVDVERHAARAEMTTKQIIATGGGTVGSIGIVGLIKQDVVGGIIYALTYGLVGFLNDLFENAFKPISNLIGGFADIIGSALTGSLLDAGWRTAAQALQSYGIIAPFIAAIVTFGVAGLLYVVLRRVDVSPLKLIYDKMP